MILYKYFFFDSRFRITRKLSNFTTVTAKLTPSLFFITSFYIAIIPVSTCSDVLSCCTSLIGMSFSYIYLFLEGSCNFNKRMGGPIFNIIQLVRWVFILFCVWIACLLDFSVFWFLFFTAFILMKNITWFKKNISQFMIYSFQSQTNNILYILITKNISPTGYGFSSAFEQM